MNRLVIVGFFSIVSALAVSKSSIPDEIKEVGVDEHLGAVLPLSELRFNNESGRELSLDTYVNGEKPIVLMLGYYKCPKLCSLILNGFIAAAKAQKWSLGQEYDLVMVSIDPKEGPALATKKKAAYVRHYGREGGENGIHFLSGNEQEIKKLADFVGINYKYNPGNKHYAHPAVIAVLAPSGKITRYLYGIDFSPSDLKLALIEGSKGKVGTIVERILLFCYQYDPELGSYSFTITKILRVLALLTIIGMAVFILGLRRRQGRLAAG